MIKDFYKILPCPDQYIYFKLTPESAMKRIFNRGEEDIHSIKSNLAVMKSANQNLDAIAMENDFYFIDAELCQDDLHNEILKLLVNDNNSN